MLKLTMTTYFHLLIVLTKFYKNRIRAKEEFKLKMLNNLGTIQNFIAAWSTEGYNNLETLLRKWRKFDFTLIGVHGNSGKAAATALAPASLVYLPTPTKNSLPTNMKMVIMLSILTIK